MISVRLNALQWRFLIAILEVILGRNPNEDMDCILKEIKQQVKS